MAIRTEPVLANKNEPSHPMPDIHKNNHNAGITDVMRMETKISVIIKPAHSTIAYSGLKFLE